MKTFYFPEMLLKRGIISLKLLLLVFHLIISEIKFGRKSNKMLGSQPLCEKELEIFISEVSVDTPSTAIQSQKE